MLKKLPLNKISGTKNALFFLSRGPTHHSFTFNFRILYQLKYKVGLSKTVHRIFHFRFCFFFIKFIFLFNKQNSFQNQNNRKVTYSFAPWALLFRLQPEVLKFSDICVSWSFPKTDLEANFLNLESQSFEDISFSR